MISCHELRTGNIILVNNRLRKVATINSNTLADHSFVGVESITNEETEPYNLKSISPVPMTDAILHQCNFIYREYFKFWQLVSTGKPRTEMNIDLDYTIIDFMRQPVVKRVTSLHQLQNNYFMLHGKELDFDVDTTTTIARKGNVAISDN